MDGLSLKALHDLGSLLSPRLWLAHETPHTGAVRDAVTGKTTEGAT